MLRKKKYNNQITEINGIIFHSKKEARYYQELLLRERAGEITEIALQPCYKIHINNTPIKIRSEGFPNGRAVKYIADFSYKEVSTNKCFVVDVKGVLTDVFKLKRALVEHIYQIEITIV